MSLLLLFTFFVSSSSTAQQIWQNDLSIEKLSVEKSGGYYVFYLTFKSNGDFDVRSPKLIFNLPRNSSIRAITLPKSFESTAYQIFGSEAQALPPGAQSEDIDSYINFDLSNLRKDATATFKISILAKEKGLPKAAAASAFIYSLTPEADKNNNFKSISIN
ncbi:MAG: hypothetical protein AAGA77_03870 [Bacteroidota bacterium]